MLRSTLPATLLGLSGSTHPKLAGPALKPTTPTAFFIEKGHVMEVLNVSPGKRVVALFFGPEEFAVRCHPFSELQALDKLKGNPFTYSMILRTLRKFPESHVHYREMRRRYHEKVAARLHSLQTMTDQQRYEQLAVTQPWALKLADPEDIASYLGISVGMLREFRK